MVYLVEFSYLLMATFANFLQFFVFIFIEVRVVFMLSDLLFKILNDLFLFIEFILLLIQLVEELKLLFIYSINLTLKLRILLLDLLKFILFISILLFKFLKCLFKISQFMIKSFLFLHPKHPFFSNFTNLFLKLFYFLLQLWFNFLMNRSFTFHLL